MPVANCFSAEAAGPVTGAAEIEGVAGTWVSSVLQALVILGSVVSGESILLFLGLTLLKLLSVLVHSGSSMSASLTCVGSGVNGENEFAVGITCGAYEMSCSICRGVGTWDEGSMGKTGACN